MARSVLDKAKTLFLRKKYADVIKLLEPNVLEYRDSFLFHLYLGLSCLHLGQIEGAVDYFYRAEQLEPRNPDLLSAQAVIALRRNRTNRAIELYLRALEEDENYRLAKRGLDFIRCNTDPEALGDFIQSGRIKTLYPVPGRTAYRLRSVAVVAALTFSVLLVIGLLVNNGTETMIAEQRADLSHLALERSERRNPVESAETTTHYILTEDEVLSAYRKAQDYFQQSQDNLTQIEINRLLFSNASFAIKQKARSLQEYLETPGFESVRNLFSYEEVKSDPFLYTDCWIVWKGMATNMQLASHASSFEFLVGYDTKERLEGVVPAFCGFVADIDPERPLSVLAQVKTRNDTLYLLVKSIYQSKLPQSTRN